MRLSARSLQLAVCLALAAFPSCTHPSNSGAGEGGEELRIGGGVLELSLDPDLPVPHELVVDWIHGAAVAVSGYIGWFPVKHVAIVIRSGGDAPVSGGMTYAGSRIVVRLGASATADDLRKDWVMTHEMFHLAFPTLDERYSWMMEGLCDFLEPVARARAGQLAVEKLWRDLVRGLPQGEPEPGDRGLDWTPTWGRTYWGGTLYWLLAELRIREQTHDEKSVGDVVRAILRAGGDGSAEWSLERVLDVGDRATGTRVLADLHDELGSKPERVDLDALWKRLGISVRRGSVRFDESAPLARIRASVTGKT